MPGYADFFQLIQHCLYISPIPKALGYKAEAAVFHPGKQAPGICPEIVGKGLNPLLQNIKAQNLFQSVVIVQDYESHLKIFPIGQRRDQKVGKTGFIQNPCGAVHDLFRILYRQLGNHQAAGTYEVLNNQVGKEKLNEDGREHKDQKQVNGELLQPGNQEPVLNQGVDDGKEMEAGENVDNENQRSTMIGPIRIQLKIDVKEDGQNAKRGVDDGGHQPGRQLVEVCQVIIRQGADVQEQGGGGGAVGKKV